MKQEKSLLSIAVNLIDYCCDGINIDNNELPNETKQQIKMLEEVLSTEDVTRIAQEPQIKGLIKLYDAVLFNNHIAIKLEEGKQNINVTKDDIYTYIKKAIDNCFHDLYTEEKIIKLIDFFDIVIRVCDEKYLTIIKRSSNEREGVIGSIEQLIYDVFSYDIDKINEEIKRILNCEFVPHNKFHEEKKISYNKMLQRINRSGFIYMLGEYNYSDFYIPPRINSVRVDNRVQYSIKNMMISTKKDLIHTYISEQPFGIINWKYVFAQEDTIYVIGGAGYGKSLFLKNIINNIARFKISDVNDYLIILCDLKSFYTDGNRNKTIVDFLLESMIKITGMEGLSKDLIQYHIKRGRCLVLLDALDEVPKMDRAELNKKITSYFIDSCPGNKICITSRSRGFIPENDIVVFEIMPLGRKDIEKYLDNMTKIRKFREKEKKHFLEQADALIEKGLLDNFLILSLLVSIYKAEKELPENKIDLYKKCFEYIAKKREEEKSKTGYDWKTIYPLMKDSTFIGLSTLAAPNNRDLSKSEVEMLLLKMYSKKYSDEATTENAINEFLEFCANRTELFVLSSSDEKYKFFHRSFFEYFYSRYIFREPSIEKIYSLMEKFDADSEVFELTIALIKEDDEEKYQNIIEYIFTKVEHEFESQKKDEIEYTAFIILTLIMQVVDDEAYIERYYDIVIEHKKTLLKKDALCVNQQLIFMWVDKLCTNTEKREAVLDNYKSSCVEFFLESCDYKNILGIKAPTVEKFANYLGIISAFIEEANNRDVIFDLTNRKIIIPFYLLLYFKYYSLKDLVKLIEDNMDYVTNSLSIINAKKKRMLKKGASTFRKLSDDEKQLFLYILSNRDISGWKSEKGHDKKVIELKGNPPSEMGEEAKP